MRLAINDLNHTLKFNVNIFIYLQRKNTAERFSKMLKKDGYSIALITGELKTSERLVIAQKFRNGAFKILAATDLMSRGMDFPKVKIVVNADLPFNGNFDPSYKVYLYRSGRNGRFSKHGIIITLIESPQSFEAYRKISEKFGFQPKQIFS